MASKAFEAAYDAHSVCARSENMLVHRKGGGRKFERTAVAATECTKPSGSRAIMVAEGKVNVQRYPRWQSQKWVSWVIPSCLQTCQ